MRYFVVTTCGKDSYHLTHLINIIMRGFLKNYGYIILLVICALIISICITKVIDVYNNPIINNI